VTAATQHADRLTGWKAERSRLERQVADLRIRQEQLVELKAVRARARDIVTEVLAATQQEVVDVIEDLVTLALRAVLDESYSFELELEVARNAASATPYVVINGQRYSPRGELGGTVVDVISLALRMAMWALSSPQPAGVFILDEPGKHISRDKQERFGRLIKQLSDLLDVQFLIVSHDAGIICHADRSWTVEQTSGISAVVQNR
jgi:DNA repair ATPase RecN